MAGMWAQSAFPQTLRDRLILGIFRHSEQERNFDSCLKMSLLLSS